MERRMIGKNKLHGYGCILSIIVYAGVLLMIYGITGKYHGSYIGLRVLSIGMILYGGAILLILNLDSLFHQQQSTSCAELSEHYNQIALNFYHLQKKLLMPVAKTVHILFFLVGIVLFIISWIH